MMHSLKRLFLALALLTTVTPFAFAQGGTNSSMTGVVVDHDGGVIPGATIVVKNESTNVTLNTVTSANGTFIIQALALGTYTVNVSLAGFKTTVLKGVVVTGGVPASLRATLEIGGIETQVTVEGATPVVQTQASAVSTTLSSDQIINLPMGSRDALQFVAFLPGVQTASTVRTSEVNGLPQSTISITMDGISIQDNYLKTGDGFFARMSPRLDAVEEVTVTTAANGADANSQGATQIKFTTRSGGNKFTGSFYEYYQSDRLNSNTWTNTKNKLSKPTILQNQPGFRVQGPIVVPGLYDGRNKAFFFFNYEELHQPSTVGDNPNLLTASAQQGIFKYTASGVDQSINLYQMAAGLGLTSTPDPLINKLLADIRAAANSSGTIAPLSGNFLTERLTFQQPVTSLNRYPTVRLDYNLTSKHRVTGSYNRNNILSTPDTTNSIQPTFPGFPVTGEQASIRYTWSGNLRSTLGANLVNDFHFGGSGGPTQFSPSLVASMFSASTANMNGYAISFPGLSTASPTNAYPSSTKSSREGSTKVVEDTVNWLRGAHSLSFGGTMTQVDVWLLSQTAVPTLTLGSATGDPAVASMFTLANFPGSSTGQRDDARALYNLLTGRISSISGTFRLDGDTGKYVYNGDGLANGRLTEYDFFVQDNWRLRRNLSLNVGVRYALQGPFASQNSAYSTTTLDGIWGVSGNLPTCDPSEPTTATCNLFKPGVTPGTVPTFQNLGKGVQGYKTDMNNIAPTVGVNWTPEPADGFLRTLFGTQGTTSFSGGWNRAYERHGMSDFTGVFGNNPGLTQTLTRSTGNGNLGAIPHLLRDADLGPAAFCPGNTQATGCLLESPVYPLSAPITGSGNIFDPNLQIPYADTYTVGMQRALGKKSAFEVRYLGTRYRDSWTVYNMNETNIIENGFLDEFKLAQKNLQANNAAGGTRAGSFAYFGAGTGTAPLPTYLAYFSGVNKSLSTDATRYTSASFTNSNFVNPLAMFNANPFTPAGTNANTGLSGDPARRTNAVTAGLPVNFFMANPDLQGGANVTGNGGFTRYNSIQTQFRRRFSGGLQFDANYVFGRAWTSQRYSLRVDRKEIQQTGGGGDVTHALKFTWIYELPFGQGKHFASDVGTVMNGLIGGWSVNGTGRIQSGRLADLGNVRVMGMTIDEAQQAYKLRKGSDGEYVMWPQDIIDNTIKAYNTSVSTVSGFSGEAPTGRYFIRANGPDCIESISNNYGDCGVRSLVITGPMFKNVDLTIAKSVRMAGHTSAEIHFDVLNAFAIANLLPVTGVGGTALSSYQITGTNPTNGASQRVVQIQARFNW